MVDKNINIIYRAFGGEQVASTNKQIAESMIPIAKQSKTVIEQIRGGMKSTSYDIQSVAVQNRDSMGRFASGFQVVNKEIEKNIRTVEDHRQRFKMYLLSIMFFGMIIQRTFQKMAQTTLDVFMKITEAQTSAGQAVSNLSAHWEYLKFSVGEAIASFIEANPWIIELIDNIADFVQQNGQLIATLLILAIAFGGTLGLIGQLGLGISGISMSINALAGGGGISGLTAALSGLAVPILLIVATLGILWWAWNTNFLNMRQTLGTMVMGLQSAWDGGIKVIFRNIGAGAIALGAIISAVLGSLQYSWEYAWLAMYRGAATIWNAILGGLQTLYNGFVDIVNGIIWVQNMLVEKTGFGEKWAYAQKANLTGWMQDTDKMKVRMDELSTLMEGVWNLNVAGMAQTTQAWDKMIEGVSPALKGVGLGMIQSGEAFNVQQEAKYKAAATTPLEIMNTSPIEKMAATTTTNNQTINITNDINVDKMASELDIDKLTKDISTRITDSLKSYGIGG